MRITFGPFAYLDLALRPDLRGHGFGTAVLSAFLVGPGRGYPILELVLPRSPARSQRASMPIRSRAAPKPRSEMEKGMAAPSSAAVLTLRTAPARSAASVGPSKATSARHPVGRQVRKRIGRIAGFSSIWKVAPDSSARPIGRGQRARSRIAERRAEFDRKHALAVRPCLNLRQDAALGRAVLDTADAPVTVGFAQRGGSARQAGGLGLGPCAGRRRQGDDGEATKGEKMVPDHAACARDVISSIAYLRRVCSAEMPALALCQNFALKFARKDWSSAPEPN